MVLSQDAVTCCTRPNVSVTLTFNIIIWPLSDLYYTWLGLTTLAVLYNVLCIIVRFVFVQHLQLNYQSTWIALDYLADAVYVVDMLLRAHTGSTNEHLETVMYPNLVIAFLATALVARVRIFWTRNCCTYSITRARRASGQSAEAAVYATEIGGRTILPNFTPIQFETTES